MSVKESHLMNKSNKIRAGILPGGAMVVSEDTIPKRKENLPKSMRISGDSHLVELSLKGLPNLTSNSH